MTLKSFKHVSATSVEETLQALSKYKAKAALVAGATDLIGALKDNILPIYPEVLVNLKNIQGLTYVKEDCGSLRIGTLTKIHELETSETVQRKCRMLAEAALSVATPQIRNMGTIGGNICQQPRCWYFRYPDNIFNCLRKGGRKCYALLGENENRFSIFGAARVGAPPCSSDCPAHIDVPSYLAEVNCGNIDEAAEILLESNPIPAITGRVCPHFCEDECNRDDVDESVSIRSIERFMGDYIIKNLAKLIKSPRKSTGKNVAVIGSGPAGLSAAYYLRKKGHNVTVFEKMKEAGGMLNHIIPAYRLPKNIVRRQIKALEGMGIVFKLTTEVGADVAFQRLRAEFDSIFLATGAWKQRTLGMEKEELLTAGVDFLGKVAAGDRTRPGNKILVIGGGNVALDVATTALRLGAKEVIMACLERREEMPAIPERINRAIEEGVKMMPAWGPSKILESKGVLSGVELVQCTSVFEETQSPTTSVSDDLSLRRPQSPTKHFAPKFNPDVKTTIEADQVMLAIGQAADLSYVGTLLETKRNLIFVDGETLATSIKGVYAGGDATTGTASVIEAVAEGHKAAKSIDSYLMGDARSEEEHEVEIGRERRRGLQKPQGVYEKATRAHAHEIPRVKRSVDLEDVYGLGLKAVSREASRCLNCGCVTVNSSDIATALVALRAKIRTTKRTCQAEDFFRAGVLKTTVLDDDELVTEIEIPLANAPDKQVFLAFKARKSLDFPTVEVACALWMNGQEVGDAGLVLGAVAPVPLRMKAAEDFLKGKVLTEEVAERAAALTVKDAYPLSGNQYKVQVTKTLVKRAILSA